MTENPFSKAFELEKLFKIESPKKVEPKKVEAIKVEEIPKNESEHARILREHGGLESNISVRSHYWRIRP